MKIGVFLPNWIGDVAMATPALRALRKRFADATLVGVVRPYVAEVLAGTNWLDEQLPLLAHAKQGWLGYLSLAQQFRAQQFDMAVLLSNSFRTGLLARLSGAAKRVGFVRYGRGPLLTHKLYAPRVGRRWLPTPAIDSYLQVARAAGCDWESPQLELATLPADEAAADAVWKKLRLPPGERVVTLNSGGAFGSAKHWPAEHFGALARRLASQHDLAVLVNCGPSEREIARQIVAHAGHPRVVSLADEQVPIGLTKACIRRSRLLVTTDSGPRFFGVAFGLPVVTLFGPTHPDWSRTHWPREVCLTHDLPCRPCMSRACPLKHHRCLRDLAVDRVFQACESLLTEAPATIRAA